MATKLTSKNNKKEIKLDTGKTVSETGITSMLSGIMGIDLSKHKLAGKLISSFMFIFSSKYIPTVIVIIFLEIFISGAIYNVVTILKLLNIIK